MKEETLVILIARWLCIVMIIATNVQGERSRESAVGAIPRNVPIDFDGFLPGNQDITLAGVVPVEFAIYLSPTGGRSVWSEKLSVPVSNGRISVQLGLINPIPWSITIANFKFLSACVAGGTEVLPRMPIVNVVYFQESSTRKPESEYASGATLERLPRPGATWTEALLAAIEEDTRLPSYREWYAAANAALISDCVARYEWTMPWVYDTASHGPLNEHFRGRFQGCDYMDLDPALNKYAYRLIKKPTGR